MNKRANIGLLSSIAFHGILVLILAFSGIFAVTNKAGKVQEITFIDITGGGGGGGNNQFYNSTSNQLEKNVKTNKDVAKIVTQDYSPDNISSKDIISNEEVVAPEFGENDATRDVNNSFGSSGGTGSGSGNGDGTGTGNGSGTGTGSGSGNGTGSGEGSGSGSGTGNRVSVPPRLLKSSNPKYPIQARQAGIEGQVVLRIRVDAEGEVTEVKVVSSSGNELLDNAASQEVWKWEFAAAKNAFGKKVACYVTRTIGFNLNDR